jgi:hypothetical protein
LSGNDDSSLILLPEVRARGQLEGRELSLRLLLPPYPALGLGVLRVLRIVEREGRTEIVAGYDGYERLFAAERPGSH